MTRSKHMTSWPPNLNYRTAGCWTRACSHMTTSRRTHLRTDWTYLTPLAHDQAWTGRILRGLQSGTQTDRKTNGQTDRQIQNTEPFATCRPVRSAPGYFTSDGLFLWYCKVQFCRHTGADYSPYKQVVDNGSRSWLVESLSVRIGGVTVPACH